MGRPFIIYDDEQGSQGDLPSTSSQLSHEAWIAKAREVLKTNGIDSDAPGASNILLHLVSTRHPVFTPVVEPAPPGGLDLLASKIGGLPYLLPSESWPTNNGSGLCHIWQQHVSELPEPVQRALGHRRGLMQVFLADTLDEDEGEWYLVRVLEEEQLVPRDPSAVSPDPNTDVLEEKRIVSYTKSYDMPIVDDALALLPESFDASLAEEIIMLLMDHDMYDTLSGDKLLGWPNWCQGPEWCISEEGERYLQVMQVEGSVIPFVVGDSGTLVLQRHPTDRERWDVSWACT